MADEDVVKMNDPKPWLLDNQRAIRLLKYLVDGLNGRCYVRDVGLGVASYYCFFCGEEKPSHRSGCCFVEITDFLNTLNDGVEIKLEKVKND